MVEQYLEGKLMVDECITHTLIFEKINEAFDLMHRANSDNRKCKDNCQTMFDIIVNRYLKLHSIITF
ncbi:alcohol dehydrogenase class-3-like [Tachypleus tridentatus]|uniref:alcohol dehydrogenase class-3-like n=1 Tax=Tachypleus tridentatus TaxID=6853 RepID=UPI003FD26C3D